VSEPSEGRPHDHFVQFYDDDLFLIDSLRDFVADGLAADESVVVAATQAHNELLLDAVAATGIDLDDAIADGRYVFLDAATLLETFMVEGSPDPERFDQVIGKVVSDASDAGRLVRVFGEMVAILWDEGNVPAAIALEDCWNKLGQSHHFTLYCAYPMRAFEGDTDGASFEAVCDHHSTVVPSEHFSALADPDERLRAVAELQQRTRSRTRELEALKVKEAELQAALCRIEELEQVRSEFLAMVVHDIRSPAAVVSGLLQVLKSSSDVKGRDKEVVSRSIASTQQLLNLIDDMSTVSKIDGGRFTFRSRRLDLVEIVRETVETFDQATPQVAVKLVAAPHLPDARGDQIRQVQVLANLLTNAVKFSPPGSTVSVSVGRRRNELVVRVRDEGYGIPVEDATMLFRPLSRLGEPPWPDVKGSGLGLYICKLLVEGQGGEIWVEQRPGGGTTFAYTVPITKS
jgi:signal transduction histidine kinase